MAEAKLNESEEQQVGIKKKLQRLVSKPFRFRRRRELLSELAKVQKNPFPNEYPTIPPTIPTIPKYSTIVEKTLTDNDEYFVDPTTFFSKTTPNDHDEAEYSAQLAHALKEGSVKLNITKCVFQGPPRVGKTHIKCLLLKQKLNKQSNPTLSTPCTEHPERAIRKVKATAYAGKTGEEEWELMDDELLAQMISEIAGELIISNNDDDDEVIRGHASKEVFDTLKEKLKASTSSSSLRAVSNYTRYHCQNTSSGQQYQDLMYFIDSGGQPQFQEVLQAFIPNTDVLLLAFNLTQKLSESPLIQYQSDKGTHTLGKYAISNEEIISRFARSSNSNRKVYVGLIGTHRDQYSPDQHESMKEKNERLRQIFAFCKDQLLDDFSSGSLLFQINALQAEDGVFDDPVVCQLRNAIGTIANKMQVKIPLKWYALELALQKHANRHGQVLALETCVELSKDLKFAKAEDVLAALKYLTDYNLILYYPSILPNVIFASSQVLLDKVTELTECVYTLSTKHVSGIPHREEYLTMVKEGIVTNQILMDFPSHYNPSLFTVEDFVKILEHLYIISRLDDGRYFMPALLPPFILSELEHIFDPSKPPLLFDFTNSIGCAPTGLFCSVLVCLTSIRSWKVKNLEVPLRGVWSNAVCLTPPLTRLLIILIDSFYQFEVHYRCPDGEEKFLHQVHEAITSAIEEVIHNRKFDIPPPRIGFLCKAIVHTNSTFESLRSTSRHACILREEDGQLICSVDSTADCGQVTPPMKQWLSPAVHAQSLLKANSKHIPTLDELFCSTRRIANEWYELGTILGIPTGTLDSIESEKNRDTKRLIAVYSYWQRNPTSNCPYTWETIVNVLRKNQNNELADEISAAKHIDTKKN